MSKLMSLYYFFTRLWYSAKWGKIGRKCKLRFGNTCINGQYMTMGDDCVFGKNMVAAVYPEFGGEECPVKKGNNNLGIHIGNHVSGNRNITIYCAESVVIGDDVMMGSHILVTDNNHGMNPEKGQYHEQPLETKATRIGEGCWIGEQVCVLAGSQIGKKCIIAANSVVTGIIPDFSIAAGTPARVIKKWNPAMKKWEKTV